jgi:two-component system nitrate/nitrite response regulator NarL
VPIDLVLADDHPIVLAGLENLFRRTRDIRVVASCSDGVAALQAVEAYRPDVLVLDLRMPRLDGLGVLRKMRDQKLSTRAILLTVSLERSEIAEAIRLGARGVLLKEMAPQLIVKCVRDVHAGKQWIEPPVATPGHDGSPEDNPGARQLVGVLTPRELEVVRAVVLGLRNKEIADRLSITESTVKIHLHAVYDKLQLDGRTALILHLKATGFV